MKRSTVKQLKFYFLGVTALVGALASQVEAKTLTVVPGQVVYMKNFNAIVIKGGPGNGSRLVLVGYDSSGQAVHFTTSPVCKAGQLCPQFAASFSVGVNDVTPNFNIDVLKADDHGALIAMPLR